MMAKNIQILPVTAFSLVFSLAVSAAFAASQTEPSISDSNDSGANQAQPESYVVPPEKMQMLLQKEKYLERQIAVRQKNANQRKDASAQQYNLGYEDGYNKALLDLLKSQLLNGIKLSNHSQRDVPPASYAPPPVLPAISQPPRQVLPSAANVSSLPANSNKTSNRMPATQLQQLPGQSTMSTTTGTAAANTGSNVASQSSSLPAIKSAAPSLVPPAAAALAVTNASGAGSGNQAGNSSNRDQANEGNSSEKEAGANVFPGKSVPLANEQAATSAASSPAIAAKKPSPKFEEMMSLSTRALQNKQWKYAAEYASRAIAIKNDVAAAYINRSWALAELGDTRQSLVDANLSIQLQPKLGLAYNNRAYTYELMDNLPEARKDYQRACQFGFQVACSVLPKVDEVLAQRSKEKKNKVSELLRQSEALIGERNWPQVIAISTQILQLDPSQASAYINRAWARAESGKLEASLADAGKAIIINPRDPVAYNNRAYTYELMNDIRSARRDYAKACELKLASACKVVEKIDQLNQKQADKTAPVVAPAKSSKALTKKEKVQQLITHSFEKFRQGNWSAVEQLSNKILKIDPNNALAYVNRAGARTEMGLVYNALDDIEKAISINPRLGIAYNNKGYTLERMGDNKKAVIQYQKACQLGLQQSCKDFKRLTKSR